MRILFLTQWFEPEPTFKGLAFASALRDSGHEVEVITGYPNYPDGKVYPGYRVWWLNREENDGIRINRVPLYPSHDRSAVGRALNYITFAITSSLLGVFGVRRADVIYCYHPPLTVGLSAAVIGLLRRIPVVCDIQDLWPDTLKATEMVTSLRLLNAVECACRFVYRHAARLVVLSPGFKRELVARGVPGEKIDVIYNWCDEGALLRGGCAVVVPEIMVNRFNVVFAGTMGLAQALDSVLAAAALVAKIDEKIQFVFVGGGIDVERLKERAARQNLTNVRFLQRMPMSEVRSILQAADALLVHLRDDPLFSITIPSKTQAYMAIGKPIIMAVRGDAADLVTRSVGGVLAEPEAPESIAAAVLELASMSRDDLVAMGQRASEFYCSNLSLRLGAEHFTNVFSRARLS